MNNDWKKVLRQAGVRPVTELPLKKEALAVRRPRQEIASLRPVLFVTDNPHSDEIRRRAALTVGAGYACAVYVPRPDDGTVKTCAARAEDILDAARRLSHATCGRTVEIVAEGAAIEPAAWMYHLERFCLSTFTAIGTCPDRAGYPTWKELVK